MKLFNLLLTAGGLSLLHFIQTLLFSIMLYILAAEFIRTRREDLIYKMTAAAFVTLISLALTAFFLVEYLYNAPSSQKYFPLIINSLFIIVVLSLARAFVYDVMQNKERFDRFIKGGMISSGIVYVFVQFYWALSFQAGMVFRASILQLPFSIFFIAVLIFSIYHILRFRKTFRARLTIAFGANLIIQCLTIFESFSDTPLIGLRVVQATLLLLVPIMFISVVFKELITSVVVMVEQLNDVYEIQKDLVFELMQLAANLSLLADELARTAHEGWQKLSYVVEKIYRQKSMNKKLITNMDETLEEIHSANSSIMRVNAKILLVQKQIEENTKLSDDMKTGITQHISEIEMIATMSDNLNELIHKLNSKANIIIEMAGELQKFAK